MRKRRASPAYFARGHETLAERVNKSVRDFLGQPNEENTHSLRASVRRLEACMRIIPKDIKKKKSMKDYRFRCRRILKVTSKIRDLDTLGDKLSRQNDKEGVTDMRKIITKERQKAVRRSMKVAWKLFELRISPVDEKDFPRLDQRIHKVLNDLDMVIGQEVHVVTSDETKLEELHSLRKHCKKFRYTLELMPSTGYNSEAPELLQRWQDALGAIRDSDVMIDYLGISKYSRAPKALLVAERAARHRRYLAFVRSYAKASGGTGLSLVALAGIA